MKYTAHMWPFFLYSSTQYGRTAASCVPRMHKSQFDREKGVWGNSLFSELCLYSLGLPFYVGKGGGQKLSRHNYYCYAMRFLGLSSLKMKIPLLFPSFNTSKKKITATATVVVHTWVY